MNADDYRNASALVETTYNQLAEDGRVGLSVDKLPYTEDFERLYLCVTRRYPLTRHEVFVMALNHRKAGRCPAPSGRKS